METNDLMDVNVGDRCLKSAGDHSKEKRIESVLVEDGDAAALHEKGNLGNDGNLGKKDKKKRETESSQDNHLCTKKARIEEKNQGPINEGECDLELRKKKKKKNHVGHEKEPKAKGKSKKVSFSDHLEVFPSSDAEIKKPPIQTDNLVRGKRFTSEEDEIVKEAVFTYIKTHGLGKKGLAKVLNCGSYPKLKNCWKEIGSCIPNRPYASIYYRAHILFERGEKHAWTEEETEILQECYEKHGNNWKLAAEELGKHKTHVKDKWRQIKSTNRSKKGKWSQEEYQQLHDLVNLDLQMKVAFDKKRSKHGMLRDDIHWGAISDKLSTRGDKLCCSKWYSQLTSSLVEENKWSNVDDYRLISALYDLDAACVEDVDWDGLLEHRPGDVCRKRWDQMVLHIGHHGSKPFSEQVEILSTRYRPDMEETMEAWDSKPAVQ